MSNILKFPIERIQRRSYKAPDLSKNAEIVVFEGIRYENDEASKNASNGTLTNR